jgi:hypothetical protein
MRPLGSLTAAGMIFFAKVQNMPVKKQSMILDGIAINDLSVYIPVSYYRISIKIIYIKTGFPFYDKLVMKVIFRY